MIPWEKQFEEKKFAFTVSFFFFKLIKMLKIIWIKSVQKLWVYVVMNFFVVKNVNWFNQIVEFFLEHF